MMDWEKKVNATGQKTVDMRLTIVARKWLGRSTVELSPAMKKVCRKKR